MRKKRYRQQYGLMTSCTLKCRLTAIQGMKYKNKAEFMQRKKSLTQYLKRSDALDSIYEQEVERLHKMEKEIEKKNNDGKDKGNDSETETAKTE